MRAFKQFLSLVLVTCMLTSMFAIVSAAGPTGEKTWDSDSGYVTITQQDGNEVDSAYTRMWDSGTVEVELSKNVSIDINKESNVQVKVTGAQLSGQYDLYVDVVDSGVETKSFVVSTEPKANTSMDPEKGSDNKMIEFDVPALMMAGGTALEIYGEGVSTNPLWKIPYTADVKLPETGFATEESPAKVELVQQTDGNVFSETIPAAAVAGILSVLPENAQSADIQITPVEGTTNLLLDTNIFDNERFKADFTLNIQVGNKYTWTFSSVKTSQQKMAPMFSRGMMRMNAITPSAAEEVTNVNLSAQMDPNASFASVSGTSVKFTDTSNLPSGKTTTFGFTSEQEAGTELAVFVKPGEKWEEAQTIVVGADGKVSFKVTSGSTEYAIVPAGTSAADMNGESTTPPTETVTIALDQSKAAVKVDATTTITATVTPAGTVTWTANNDNVELTPNGNTVTVTGAKVGFATVTATIGNVSASCEIEVQSSSSTSEEKPNTNRPSTESGGNGSWNDGGYGTALPTTGSGTTTTPGTTTTNPGATSGNAQPQGCVSDTVGNFSINGVYQYKLTSTNGTVPAVTVSNSNFRVVLASQNGNDYFYKVYAIGAPGQTCDVYVNGTKVSTVTASAVYGGVMSDTTAPFTVKKGASYQFKLTASSQPTMVAGSSSFRVEYVGNSGNDWFFKVYAIGNAGDGCGFYVNGAPFTVAVAHISE